MVTDHVHGFDADAHVAVDAFFRTVSLLNWYRYVAPTETFHIVGVSLRARQSKRAPHSWTDAGAVRKQNLRIRPSGYVQT